MSLAPSIALTRVQLYEMIWAEAARALAPKLGISDVGLAKVCRKYHIPRPWRGYWREKETGKRVHQPKLLPWPRHLGPEPEKITFQSTPRPGPAEPPAPKLPTVATQIAHEQEPENTLVVPVELSEPDRLVSRALRLLKRPKEEGYLTPRERPCLDVHVSNGSLDRSLRIMDALLKGCRKRSWSVACQPAQPWRTQVQVLDETIDIRLFERVKTIKPPHIPYGDPRWPSREKETYEATGQLTLALGFDEGYWQKHQRTWSDGKRQRLEGCLQEIMVAFVEVAERRKQLRREDEERERKRREEEQQRQVAAERREREKARRAELREETDAWFRWNQLKSYLEALRGAAQPHIASEPDGRLARWIRWAERYLVKVNPLADPSQLPGRPESYSWRDLDLSEFGPESGNADNLDSD